MCNGSYTSGLDLGFIFKHRIYSVEFLFSFLGVLKDYLRELPEPLVTNALYQMLLDALSVRLPSDPDGSAKLMLSILECLPKANQVSTFSRLTLSQQLSRAIIGLPVAFL